MGSPHTRFIPLVVLIVVSVICGVVYWQRPNINRGLSWENTQASVVSLLAPRMIALPGTTAQLLSIKKGLGSQDDLFQCTAAFDCVNLTQSPGITEVWPVLDAAAEKVAYYGVGEQATELHVLELSTSAITPVTLRAGTSGLHTKFVIIPNHAPVFSPDGDWLAFPAQAHEGGAVELFVARTDGQQVLCVSDLGHQVQDYIWLDAQTLLIHVQREDDAVSYWAACWDGAAFQLESLP